jgi:hypothetical protein
MKSTLPATQTTLNSERLFLSFISKKTIGETVLFTTPVNRIVKVIPRLWPILILLIWTTLLMTTKAAPVTIAAACLSMLFVPKEET